MKNIRTIILLTGILVAGIAYNTVAQSQASRREESKSDLKNELKAASRESKAELKNDAKLVKMEAHVHKHALKYEIKHATKHRIKTEHKHNLKHMARKKAHSYDQQSD